jgi:hypothetical protein
MTNNDTKGLGLMIHAVNTPEGAAALATHSMTVEKLKRAVDAFRHAEAEIVGTIIGVHPEHGLFYSTCQGWHPERAWAFDEPIGVIPWEQLKHLLAGLDAVTVHESNTFN